MDVQTASLPAWTKTKSIKRHLLYNAHTQLTEPVSHFSGETTHSLLTFKINQAHTHTTKRRQPRQTKKPHSVTIKGVLQHKNTFNDIIWFQCNWADKQIWKLSVLRDRARAKIWGILFSDKSCDTFSWKSDSARSKGKFGWLTLCYARFSLNKHLYKGVQSAPLEECWSAFICAEFDLCLCFFLL